MSRIQDGDIAWAPPLSFGLRKSLDIALLSQLGNLTQMHKSPGAGTLSTTGSTAGGTMIPGIISAGGEVPGGIPQCHIPTQRSHPRGLAQGKGWKGIQNADEEPVVPPGPVWRIQRQEGRGKKDRVPRSARVDQGGKAHPTTALEGGRE